MNETPPAMDPQRIPPVASIQKDTLLVRVPLQMMNGQVVALGLLQVAIQLVHGYFEDKAFQEHQAKQTALLNEKGKIDAAILK